MPLLRRSCLVCGRRERALCEVCARRLTPPPSTRVRGVGRVTSLFAYEGTGATVVQSLKYREGRRLVSPLADGLAESIRDGHAPCSELSVTWLPTTAERRRARGFDQSELLARAVARRLGIPVVSSLRRVAGEAQTGRGRAEREANVRFRATRAITGPLIVIDDVCTTGATIRAGTTALRAAGARDVHPVTVARTP